MANPFTYVELHTTDADRAKTFYTELFGWKTKDTMVPGFGVYTTSAGSQPGISAS